MKEKLKHNHTGAGHKREEHNRTDHLEKTGGYGKTMTGQISTTAKGAGYIDDPNHPKLDSVYVEPGKLNCALNGDMVEFVLETRKSDSLKEKVGKVVKIISRAKINFVGVLALQNGRKILMPDDRKMYVPIELHAREAEHIGIDEKVYVELESWTDPSKNPSGKILRVLGKKGNNDVEMESIVLEKGFAVGFPKEVVEESEKIALTEKTISADEIRKRRDFRKTLTFTIDPFDAKDFDDAISYRELGGGLFEIGVHIADVSHYVREGTAINDEAAKRGCSVYLVDRTIPMLPEILSNDICSLNPNEDKLAFSAVFVMDEKAHISERWFGKTIINSAHRFTYENAQSVIDGKDDPGSKFRGELVTLNKIAKVLQRDKFSHGAIEFEQDEVKFKLDPNGKPVGVYIKERLDTHKLVEEYMLLANKEVAKYIFDSIKRKGLQGSGSIYRIHDLPDKDRMKELSLFVKALGYDLRTTQGQVSAKDINHLLNQIEGTPHESLIRTATIRSMQKAVYSTQNIGHFGLAFEFYTHFTSPIRRYPDLLVHRTLSKHLHNEPFVKGEIGRLQKLAETSTDREIDAAEAERSSRKLKQVEYMSEKIGQTFTGKISGVTKWGIYVEESLSRSEGMINFNNLGNDYYVFDERTYTVKGEKSGRKYTLGDEISFKVVGADLDKKTLGYQAV